MADARRRYAAAWPTLRDAGFPIGLLLIAAYVALRTLGGPELLYLGWIVAAAATAIAWPIAGMTVLAAIGPFTEALTAQGQITAAPVLVAVVGASVALRVVISRRLPRLSAPLLLAVLIFAGTALGVANSFRLAGPELGMEAARLWVPGIGGGLTVFLAAAWVGGQAELRPLLVVAASVAVAAVLSIADLASDGQIRSGPLGWLLRSDSVQDRLGGIIPAPNAVAAILLVALSVAVAALLFARRSEFRLLAAAALPPIAIAMVLTYSRSALLGTVAVAGLLAWRIRRAAGVAVVLAALVVAIVLTPGFLTARGVPIDPTKPPSVGQTPGDEFRVAAWQASVRMWLDAPLTGHGFRSFEWLHREYGAVRLNAPHNEWLRLFAEEGLFVGIAGVGFAALTVISLLRRPGWVAIGASAAAAGLFVMASFNNPFLYTQVNVPAFLVIGTGLGWALRAPTVRPDQPSDSDGQPSQDPPLGQAPDSEHSGRL